MRKTLLLALVAVFLTGGCASSPRGTAPAPTPAQAPLPDARDLAEHPLDVLDIPQP